MEKHQEVLNDISEKSLSGHLSGHPVVSHEEWIAARKLLLKKEKELTKLNDQLSEQRRNLPWTKVDKTYQFEGIDGKLNLSDLFEGNSQLMIYHFMFGPDDEEGCPGCSFLVDHLDGANLHLAHHDVSVVVVSRAPLPKLLAFKKRMEWNFKWVSSSESDFNYDFNVSFTEEQIEKGEVYYNYEYLAHDSGTESPGMSVFFKDEAGNIYHSYSNYGRGGDILIGAHNYLDLTPKGRNEDSTMDWMRHHDKYDDFKGESDSCCH
ncbi:DUF899 domain-containing protein [Dyadobacter arcticus]|uniref:Dithiol-disulfide oxidoreductase (DUF899 family) n=1 Tax=Dyadobacter arcticus TaxID=1078754 RepID=A0ABX0URM8_9BACT|nr:thioredoxin family protein [Dyadobacter arcticus]NIJ55063.1 putative dithiol-disulfide oxidoreductase (DUF899 family) [Dyadobacter arcticus]